MYLTGPLVWGLFVATVVTDMFPNPLSPSPFSSSDYSAIPNSEATTGTDLTHWLAILTAAFFLFLIIDMFLLNFYREEDKEGKRKGGRKREGGRGRKGDIHKLSPLCTPKLGTYPDGNQSCRLSV